jgi:hypothetical protein
MLTAPPQDKRSVVTLSSHDMVVAIPAAGGEPARYVRTFGQLGLTSTTIVPPGASWSLTFSLMLTVGAPESRYETAATYDLNLPPTLEESCDAWAEASAPAGLARDAALALALSEIDAVRCCHCGKHVGWSGDGDWNWAVIEVPTAGGARYSCEGCAA